MAWTLCTSGAAIAKAGVNANSTIIASGSTLANWSSEAEARISSLIHTNATTLATPISTALGDICSSMIAMNIIAYDTRGYLSREADTLMNFNDDIITKGLANLSNKQNQRVST
jgi:hypothetical protein